MTYRAAWYEVDGVTPAAGLDLSTVQPGKTASVTRLLKNTGDDVLSEVQFTLKDALSGVSVQVDGHDLVLDETYITPPLPPGESVSVVYTRVMPIDAPPGPWSAFIQIRALT